MGGGREKGSERGKVEREWEEEGRMEWERRCLWEWEGRGENC